MEKNKIQAVIFDLDGTVIDNEGIWNEVFELVARNNEIDLSKVMKMPNGWFHEPGLGILQNWKRVAGEKVAEKLYRETWNLYSQRSLEEKMVLREGVVDTVQLVKDRGWMTALCTGSNWNVVETELENLGLYLAFDVTTTGDEVLLLKPDPEIYLLTAQKLGVDPEECLVIEDAIAGIRSAVEAGAAVAGLVSGYAPEKMIKGVGANYIVSDFSEVMEIISTLE
jgi:beta-phosphoglucomutase